MAKITIVKRSPTVEEYQKLRRAVGWPQTDEKSVAAGLQNSLFALCAEKGGETVGCGRIVGDGAIYFYIQDVIVLPQFQGKNVGGQIMSALFDYLRAHVQPGAFIGLMAASGSADFYRKFGFSSRPDSAPGMYLV